MRIGGNGLLAAKWFAPIGCVPGFPDNSAKVASALASPCRRQAGARP